MTLREMRVIAKQRGLKLPASIGKVELVRRIQREEGNPECFATSRRCECPELGCLWRDDCKCLHAPDTICGQDKTMPGF